jgi:hypothetical protein
LVPVSFIDTFLRDKVDNSQKFRKEDFRMKRIFVISALVVFVGFICQPGDAAAEAGSQFQEMEAGAAKVKKGAPQLSGTVNERPQVGGTVNERPELGGPVNERPELGGPVSEHPQVGGTVNELPQVGGSVNELPQGGTVNERVPQHQ